MKEAQTGSCELAEKQCIPCKGGVPALKGEELAELHAQLPEWDVVEEHHLRRAYVFPDFARALSFVNKLGEVAEHENHHPWIRFTWGKVIVEIWTHKIDGLTESDFILAAKIDRISPE